MARQRYDIGSKWMLHNQGKGVLQVGGLERVRRCEPMPGEIVQNRRYPDGLLQVFLANDPKPHYALIEIATYPERRALKQALDDVTLAYSALDQLPEMLMLVLRPKGRFRIAGTHTIQSKLRLSRLQVEWRTVELWTLSAAEFLAAGDVGVIPWVPLMQFDGPAQSLLERCADKIERVAPAKERADLLAVAQVLSGLRFPQLDLFQIFGGERTMIESPVLQKMMAQRSHDLILDVLKERFHLVPRDVAKQVRAIVDEKKLRQLNRVAVTCGDLDTFRAAL